MTTIIFFLDPNQMIKTNYRCLPISFKFIWNLLPMLYSLLTYLPTKLETDAGSALWFEVFPVSCWSTSKPDLIWKSKCCLTSAKVPVEATLPSLSSTTWTDSSLLNKFRWCVTSRTVLDFNSPQIQFSNKNFPTFTSTADNGSSSK